MADFVGLGSYLAPVDPDLWDWDDKGEVVQWASGATIAFREEFEAILAALESDELGSTWLPPFGALVLLVAACRDEPSGWGRVDPGSSADHATPEMTAFAKHLRRVGFRGNAFALLHGLEKIHRFPPNARAPIKAKTALALEVFEGSTFRTRPVPGAGYLASVRRRDFQPALAHHALAALEQGLAKFDAAGWTTRFDVGVDDAPAPPTEEIELPETAPPTAETVRKLLDDLRDDHELAALASVARDLLAVAHLPRPVAAREDLPIGGVSDITNRGSLQHLLVAELANDDFTLAMRIAQGEALYLRREDPPSPPPGDRVLVLDAGLRMWGVPRVFATSVGLALAATTANRGQWQAFRAEGDDAIPIDLTRRDGILEHLKRLSPADSPLKAFERVYNDAATRSVREVVLITSEEAAADPAFAANLPTGRGPTLYVAAVGRDGSFKLREPRKRGLEPMRAGTFDLAALFTVKKEPPVRRASERTPPIFDARPFPLLLPVQVPDRECVLHPAGGFVAVLPGGRLIHWQNKDWGARELAASTGAGHLACLTVFPDGSVTVVRYRGSDEPLNLFTVLRDGELVERALGPFRGSMPQVFKRGATLFVVTKEQQRSIIAVDPWTGRVIARRLLENTTEVRNFRFFRDHNRWVYPTVENDKLILAPVFGEKEDTQLKSAIDLFEQPGTEEVWAVMTSGSLTPISEPKRFIAFDVPQPGFELGEVSPGGRFVQIRSAGHRFFIDLQTRLVKMSSAHEPLPHDLMRPIVFSYRTRIHAIGFGDRGDLVLTVPGGRIAPQVRFGQMYWSAPLSFIQKMRPFPGGDDDSAPPDSMLKRMPLGGRREAVLDRRGLLHFIDASGELPDVTLTLFTQDVNAAWSSRLGSVGAPYCFGDRIPYPNDWQPFLDAIAAYGRKVE